jgi:hypothetical protein
MDHYLVFRVRLRGDLESIFDVDVAVGLDGSDFEKPDGRRPGILRLDRRRNRKQNTQAEIETGHSQPPRAV